MPALFGGKGLLPVLLRRVGVGEAGGGEAAHRWSITGPVMMPALMHVHA